jgi:hypothetical protein
MAINLRIVHPQVFLCLPVYGRNDILLSLYQIAKDECMKKFTIALTVLALVFGTAACTADAPAAPTSAPAESASSAPTAAETATPTEQPADTAAPTEQPSGGGDKDYGQIGSDLMKAESIGAVKIGMTESELLAAMGQPESESEAKVWGADGMKHSDWMYQSKGITVNMSESSNPESEYTVYSIMAEAPCSLTTQKGVKIGDTKDAVLAAYGSAVEDQSEEGTKEKIVAGTVFGGLIFSMKDGMVSSVFIGASAE